MTQDPRLCVYRSKSGGVLIAPCISVGAGETMILGDGTGPGLVIVGRSLLRQICAQMNGAAIGSPGEHSGLLLGPEPERDDLLIENIIPLGSEYHFVCSPEMLLAGIDSVRPMLEEARQQRSQTIVGLYRILRSSEGSLSENCFQFLSVNGKERSSHSDVRCCFVFVCIPASKILLRVHMRNGEHWEQIQELTLPWEPPSPDLTPQRAAAVLNVTEPPNAAGNTNPMLEKIHRRDRLWVVTIVTLLMISVAASALGLKFHRRVQQEKVSPQPVVNQVQESTASVSQIRPPAPTPVLPEAASRNPPPAQENLPPNQFRNPPPAGKLATKKSASGKPRPGKEDLRPSQLRNSPPAEKLAVTKKFAPSKFQPAKEDLPPNQVKNSPPAQKLAITKKPAILKPSEAFQFAVDGNPAPEVVWSSEGPGTIDPIYGLYRAPNHFTGETEVRISASSWRGSQSVTFTLKGGSN